MAIPTAKLNTVCDIIVNIHCIFGGKGVRAKLAACVTNSLTFVLDEAVALCFASKRLEGHVD